MANQGIYHPTYNPNGSKKLSDGNFWYNTSVSINSTMDCFDSSKMLVASGNIGTTSGRPDGLFYDQVHEGDITDLRNSSKKTEDYNRLIGREFNKLVAGTYRGKEGEYGVIAQFQGTVVSKSYSGTPLQTFINITSNFTGTVSVQPYVTIGYVKSVSGAIFPIGGYATNNVIRLTSLSGDQRGLFAVNDVIDIVVFNQTTRTKSNTLLHCDIIGNPTNYPTAWKQSGVFGTPLIVAEDGTSLLPNGVLDTFKLSRKANATPLLCLRSTDNGATWTKVSRETKVLTLLSTGGNLYAGTNPSGKIFKSTNGTDWDEILDSTEDSIAKLVKHTDGYTYAATAPYGKILRSNDEKTWSVVHDSTDTYVLTLLSHTDGYVYAGMYPSGKIIRSNDGTTWAEVLDTTETHILSLVAHSDGYIYAGTGTNGKILRSNDGTTWVEVLDSTESEIFSLVSYSGYVYAGTGSLGKILRSNDGTTWNEVLDTAGTHIISFAVHTDGYLYAGTNDSGKIYRSNDGTTWTIALDSTETHVYSLVSNSDGYIYAGTYPSGRIYRSNDGTTWNEVLKPYSFNTTTNEITLTDEPANNLVMVFYQTHTSMAVPAVNSEVIEIGDVWGNVNITYPQLASSLCGKVLTELGGVAGKVVAWSTKLSEYSISDNTKKFTEAPNYSAAPSHPLSTLPLAGTLGVKVFPYLTRLNGKAYLNLVFKEMKYGSYLAPTVVTAASATYTQNMTYKINIAGCALDGKVIKWIGATTTSAIDWSLYDVSPTGVIYLLSSGVVYTNAKLYDGDSWGDDGKFNIVDNVSTTLDDNGQTVLIGQKTVELNVFIGNDE